MRVRNLHLGCSVWRALIMDYRRKIMFIINKLKDEWILEQIYLFAVNMTKEG